MADPSSRSGRDAASEHAEHTADVTRTDRPSPARLADRAGTEPSGRRALVAVVDPATLRLCREILVGSGFAVAAVDAGIAAVVAAREDRPDLILMDLQLRDVSGREAIGWLRSNPALEATPIIFLTTSAEDEAGLAVIRPGRSLRKPVSPGAMRRSIEEFFK